MKALVCSEWGHYSGLRLEELALPAPGSGQVRIAVHYATVGYGHILIVAGEYQRRPERPFVPGTEVAGVVTAIGADVVSLRVGDRVAAALETGAYAQETLARADRTWKVPDAVDLSAAVTVPIGHATSWAGLHWRARLRKGETLVVFGAAGGVGRTAVQLGRLAGAHVIAVASSAERAAEAVAQGAHVGLVHTEPDLAQRIRAANGGRRVDVVYDPVGGPLLDAALHCLRPEGRLLLVGFASGAVPQIPANLLLVKNIDVIGFNYSQYLWGWKDEPEADAARIAAAMETLFAEAASGRLRLEPGASFAFARFTEAFDAVATRRSSGRVVLRLVEDT